MKTEVLFLILNEFADWEAAFLAAALQQGLRPGQPSKFLVRTVAPTPDPVASIGGMRVVPDYDLDHLPDRYGALVLIGGQRWQSPESESVASIVARTLEQRIPLGAICGAVSFLAAHGWLNGVKHTGNTVEQLKTWGGRNYTNEAGYEACQAVRDGGIVTANGSASLEFAREMLMLLEADTPEAIRQWYTFYKKGFYPDAEH